MADETPRLESLPMQLTLVLHRLETERSSMPQ
jgi:hypothetical protein